MVTPGETHKTVWKFHVIKHERHAGNRRKGVLAEKT